MAKERTEGQLVRNALEGPSIEHDQVIDFCEARNREDSVRASSAGESRQKIGQFIEDTGMNSQALSWCRSILKKLDKDDGQNKAMDVIMSLEKALPMIKAHVAGQGQADMDFTDSGDTGGEVEPAPVGDDLPAWDAPDEALAAE
jgi:hypothetical protein